MSRLVNSFRMMNMEISAGPQQNSTETSSHHCNWLWVVTAGKMYVCCVCLSLCVSMLGSCVCVCGGGLSWPSTPVSILPDGVVFVVWVACHVWRPISWFCPTSEICPWAPHPPTHPTHHPPSPVSPRVSMGLHPPHLPPLHPVYFYGYVKRSQLHWYCITLLL